KWATAVELRQIAAVVVLPAKKSGKARDLAAPLAETGSSSGRLARLNLNYPFNGGNRLFQRPLHTHLQGHGGAGAHSTCSDKVNEYLFVLNIDQFDVAAIHHEHWAQLVQNFFYLLPHLRNLIVFRVLPLIPAYQEPAVSGSQASRRLNCTPSVPG